jgi:hypothetical protein
MYLAQTTLRGKTRFSIRHTTDSGNGPVHREIVDLGTDPSRFIVYPGGNAYYVADEIFERLSQGGVNPEAGEVDELFWRFVDPEIRQRLEHFRQRESRGRPVKRPPEGFEQALHLFDRRRVHFLRFGQMDQKGLRHASHRLFSCLYGKSRDETEQYFLDAEQILRTREFKSYVYTIFDLQSAFESHYARHMPQALDQGKLDALFIENICALNADKGLWPQGLATEGLNEYLTRYVWMYFDYGFGPSPMLDEFVQQFMGSRRFRWPTAAAAVSTEDAAEIFGVGAEAIQALSRRELTRLYRKKAMTLHPDLGGDHDRFIRLTDAYQAMLSRKKR